MSEQTFFAIVIGMIVFFAVLKYITDKQFHHEMIERKAEQERHTNQRISDLDDQFSKMNGRMDEFRSKYIEHQKEYAELHEHLQKVTSQQHLLARAMRAIKIKMVQRHEVVLPKDFVNHLGKLAKKLDEFV
jgi:septation ring formation regulator EzrA